MRQIVKEISALAASLAVAFALAHSFASPVYAAGAAGSAQQAVCGGVNLGGGTCSGGASELDKVVKAAVQILSIIAGIAAVIMLIIGGLKYVTSGGDSSSIASAKTSIIYALVGIVVVVLSQLLVKFVLTKTKGP